MSVPSNTRAWLDQLSTPGSSPLVPFRAARTPFGVRCRHFDSVARTACCRSRRISNFPDTSLCWTVNHRHGTFHDSRTESVILQAVFCWWDSSSRHELLDGFPLPHGYPPASSPGARRMNADPWSAFRLSPLREPDARTRADRFNVRATSRTCSLIHLSKIAARTGSAEWARRRSNPRLRCFKPPLYRLSYQPRM